MTTTDRNIKLNPTRKKKEKNETKKSTDLIVY